MVGKIKQNLQSTIKDIKTYNDDKILKDYGEDLHKEALKLRIDWITLKTDMERYIELKKLPISYLQYSWSLPTVGAESYTWGYNGNMIKTGFDTGPGRCCSILIYGISDKIYQRRKIQRIEWYTKWGLMVGFLGFIASLISIYISIV